MQQEFRNVCDCGLAHLSDGDPNQNKDEAIAFFKEMAETFTNNDNVLYEICNEPNGGTSWESIKAYAEEVMPVIREKRPDAVILVGTPDMESGELIKRQSRH